MKISLERVIIIVMLVAGAVWFLRGCNKDGSGGDTVEKETTTTQTIDIKETIDRAINNALANQNPERTPYIIIRDEKTGKETVIKVEDPSKLNAADLSKVKELNTYKDTTRLKNATVYSNIVSDGKIYLNDVTAVVNEKTITNSTIEKTTVQGSGMFVNGGAYVNPDLKLSGVQAGLQYIFKNDFGIGAGIILDLETKKPTYGVTVAKKIF